MVFSWKEPIKNLAPASGGFDLSLVSWSCCVLLGGMKILLEYICTALPHVSILLDETSSVVARTGWHIYELGASEQELEQACWQLAGAEQEV